MLYVLRALRGPGHQAKTVQYHLGLYGQPAHNAFLRRLQREKRYTLALQ